MYGQCAKWLCGNGPIRAAARNRDNSSAALAAKSALTAAPSVRARPLDPEAFSHSKDKDSRSPLST